MILVFDVDVSKTTSSSRSNTLVNHVDIESAFDSDRDPRGSRRAIPASHLGQCLGLWAVRKMQLKLHRWAGEDSARRFDDLYNLVSDPAFLAHAYERVARNKGARTPGVEKATVAWIESQRGGRVPERSP